MINEIINPDNQSFLKRVEGFLLLPTRYLFNGHTIKIIHVSSSDVIWDAPSFNEKPWNALNKKEKAIRCIKVAVAIALLIPSFITGSALKLFNCKIDQWYDIDHQLGYNYLENRAIYILTTNVTRTFSDYQNELNEKFNLIWKQIEDETIWSKPEFINQVSDAMDVGHRYMIAYFQDLTNEVGTDAKLKAQRMIIQPQMQKEPGKQDFSHSFFLLSRLYHMARGVAAPLSHEYGPAIGIEPDERMPIHPKSKLTLEDQEPYFNPTKPQFQWRRIYNNFCAMVDKDHLRTYLEGRDGDDRYSKWSKPDLNLVEDYPYPGTLPT